MQYFSLIVQLRLTGSSITSTILGRCKKTLEICWVVFNILPKEQFSLSILLTNQPLFNLSCSKRLFKFKIIQYIPIAIYTKSSQTSHCINYKLLEKNLGWETSVQTSSRTVLLKTFLCHSKQIV